MCLKKSFFVVTVNNFYKLITQTPFMASHDIFKQVLIEENFAFSGFNVYFGHRNICIPNIGWIIKNGGLNICPCVGRNL